jgi:hypothetical protein
MSSSVAGMIAGLIITPMIMALLAKIYPSKHQPLSVPALDVLQRKYSRWEIAFTCAYIALWIPATFVLWFPLRALSDLNAARLPAEYILTLEPIFWFLPAFFLALAVSALPLMMLFKLLLRARYEEYVWYWSAKHGVDMHRANRTAIWVVMVLVAIVVFMGLNCYVLLDKEAIVVNRFFGLRETVYRFDDVQSIQTAPQLIAPNGNTVNRREYRFIFGDGRTWSTNFLPRELSVDEKLAFAKSIADAAGREIENIAIFDKSTL